MALKPASSQSTVADDFLHIASEIVRNEHSSEGALRSAISRAYYAVFLTVRDQLFGSDGNALNNAKRKQLKKRFGQKHNRLPGSHDLIIFAITELQPKSTIRPNVLANQVRQLKEARICADYYFTPQKLKEVDADSWREFASENLALASQLLPMVRRLPSYPL